MAAPLCVSVVIPAHNEATFIPRVIRAVLAQRPAGTELEVIVADDGSTDGTPAEARAAGAVGSKATAPDGTGSARLSDREAQ